MTTLREIQAKVGVTADGILGPRTLDAIGKALDATTPVAVRDDAFTALAIEHLRAEEGVIPYAYQDHLGYWTIGVGRLIDQKKGGRLTDAEIDYLLRNDIAAKSAQLASDPDTAAAWAKVQDNIVRKTALLSMGFQMGVGASGKDDAGLSGFDTTLGMIADGNYEGAAKGMLQSLWAKQTPTRAKRVAEMMRTGKMP